MGSQQSGVSTHSHNQDFAAIDIRKVQIPLQFHRHREQLKYEKDSITPLPEICHNVIF
jgi:hypothetical protein